MLKTALDDLKTALDTALPTRVVTRSLRDFTQHQLSDLEAGILTLISHRESGYANYRGREADLGKLAIITVGQLKLPENAAPSDVEDAEFAFAEEVKTFLQTVLPVEAVILLETRFSGQLEAPYGWFAMDWEVWP